MTRVHLRTFRTAVLSVVFFGSALYVVGLSAMLSNTPIMINPDFKMPYEAGFLFVCGAALFALAVHNALTLKKQGN